MGEVALIFDLPPQEIWLPPKPAIVRPAAHWLINPLGLDADARRAVAEAALKLGLVVPAGFNPAAPAQPASVSKITHGQITVSGTGTITSGVASNASERIVAVIFTHEESTLMTGCTFAGITGTKAFGVNPSHSQRSGCELYWAIIPALTSGNIVASGSGGTYGYTSYDIFNANDVVETETYVSSSGNTASFPLSPPDGSVSIAGCNNNVGSSSGTCSNATEDTDFNPGGAWGHVTCNRTDATATTVTVQITMTDNRNGGGAAVFATV